MPAALNVGLDGNNLDRILPEWEKQGKEIQILSFFSNMPQVSTKNFPHTKRVGNYLVGKMINKGSFAKVMEGLHVPTGQKVAMKVIDKKKARQDSYVLKNMKREPRIHQMIKHPNIVQLYETLETENSYYMVMELCLGGDLMDQICDKKKLLERDARKYTRQIMSAVEHLHRHGVVHRDLKIENFLLDENCNIKIVDFGLSNTIKFEGLSQELLSTQCGSPAYAAPELLANKKYGPKVDVWSIGVSMFAMLTGTLPFTVEPFNIKQLHQKMINGEISPIPPDISSGAVHFIHTLLEPDPAKRPTIKEAMENKWLNEGFIRKQLNSVLHKNRLRPDELNSIVLNYMTETMDLSISEVINILINNRPSPVMASYCLLLKKLMKHQKENKFIKKKEPDECNSHSTMLCLEPPETDGFTKKNPFEPDIVVKTQKQEDKCSVQTKEETQNTLPTKEVILQNEIKNGKKDGIPVLQETIIEDEIAITLENQENIPEASKFAGREFVFLEPPTSSKQKWDQVVIHPPPDKHKDLNELKRNGEKHKSPIEKQSTIFLSKANQPINNQTEHNDLSAEGSSYNIKVTYKSLNKPLFQSPFPQQQGTRLKEMLKSVDHNVFPPHSQQQEKESINLVMIETANHPPLPRLRQPALRDTLTKRISWVTTSHIPKSLSPPFVINGSRPPVFPVSRQHTIMVKNLRQSKEKTQLSLDSGKIKRNTVQLRQAHKSTNLNLPMLLPPYQKRSENKNEILRLEFV